VARGLYGGEHEAGCGAGAHQELLRLWDVYADPGGFDCCAGRAAGLCRGDRDTIKCRRDVLVPGLNKLGWPVELPKATMFAWARIPEQYQGAGVGGVFKEAAAGGEGRGEPGVGFGEHGDGHVRFSLIENEERTRQALRGSSRCSRLGFLLGFEEAADAVEGAGFAEDDQAFEQRGGHGAAGDDGAEEHEVFFDGPLLFFAQFFEGGFEGFGGPVGGFEDGELLGGEGEGFFEGALLGEEDLLGGGNDVVGEEEVVRSPNWPRVSMRVWTSGAICGGSVREDGVRRAA
jgi:hypothetical protein